MVVFFFSFLPKYTKNSEGSRIKFLWNFLEAEGRVLLAQGLTALDGAAENANVLQTRLGCVP